MPICRRRALPPAIQKAQRRRCRRHHMHDGRTAAAKLLLLGCGRLYLPLDYHIPMALTNHTLLKREHSLYVPPGVHCVSSGQKKREATFSKGCRDKICTNLLAYGINFIKPYAKAKVEVHCSHVTCWKVRFLPPIISPPRFTLHARTLYVCRLKN